MPILTWDEIESAAARAFSIWTGQPELRWAKEAWQILSDAGLAAYEGELDRHRAIIRFLALAGIYSDWCAAAWGEYSDLQCSYWTEGLDVNAFRLGQLVGADEDSEDGELDDNVLTEEALHRLADAARPDVVRALLGHFGTASGLFLSLWRSMDFPHDEIDDQENEEDDWDDEGSRDTPTDDAILNEITDEKLRAFDWTQDGCYPYR